MIPRASPTGSSAPIVAGGVCLAKKAERSRGRGRREREGGGELLAMMATSGTVRRGRSEMCEVALLIPVELALLRWLETRLCTSGLGITLPPSLLRSG